MTWANRSRWSVRTLRKKIDGMLFERTALSKKPDQLIRQELDALREEDQLTPDLVFRDPYLLGFLGLRDTYAEKDLEAAILREMEAFILELGVGFAFLERQKRITVDDEDYYLDLLFYHRPLRRLVAEDTAMATYILLWDPRYEVWADFDACVQASQEGKSITIPCECKGGEEIAPGDTVFLLRKKVKPLGGLAKGRAVSGSYPGERTPMVDVEFTQILPLHDSINAATFLWVGADFNFHALRDRAIRVPGDLTAAHGSQVRR